MVTNDGATILKAIYLDNAAAKILVGIIWSTFREQKGRILLEFYMTMKIFQRHKMMRLVMAQPVYVFLLESFSARERNWFNKKSTLKQSSLDGDLQ